MSDDPIDLTTERMKRFPAPPEGYPDTEGLRQAQRLISQYADVIARQSEAKYGAIDPLAYELTTIANIVGRYAEEQRSDA